MSKRMVKVLTLVLALAMVFTAFTACGSSKTTTTGTTAKTTGPVTVKFLCYADAACPFNADMPVMKEIQKKTNVKLVWQSLPATDYDQKFNLIMASNDLPDVVSYPADGTTTLNNYGQQQALIPLNKLIDQYAPNIKKNFDNPPFTIPHLKAAVKAADGNIYSIPFLTATHTGEVLAIRKDWLDKLGLQVPKTTDDLYNVLKAFKDKNPNGKGNVIPYTAPDGVNGVTPFINPFGAHESYYVAKDNTIKYGPAEANYKAGMDFVSKCYKDGLIDQQILTKTYDQLNTAIANDQVGMFYGWPFSGLGAANTAVKKLDSKNQYVCMLPVKGPNGDQFKEDPQNMVLPRTAITKACKNVPAVMKMLDYCYSDEGVELMNWGIKGTDYTVDNGQKKFTDKVLKDASGKAVSLVREQEGMQIGLATVATMDAEKAAVTDPEIAKAWESYDAPGILWQGFPVLPYSADQQSQLNEKKTQIDTYAQEQESKFIVGKEPTSNMAAFTTKLNSLGLADVLKIQNDAFAKYLSMDK